jgi:carbonic anhydrase/acetyltransferase-like protein (isoleucine patch superfamily)
MMKGLILGYRHHQPTLGEALRLEASGALIGRSRVGRDSSFEPYATVRGDGEDIRVGRGCWFAEHATVHIADQIRGAVIGDDVTVARYGVAHACTLDDGVVIGESAMVMDDARVGPYAVIAGDSIVPPRKDLPGGFLYAGHPAKPVRAITLAEARDFAADVRRGRPAGELVSSHLPTWNIVVGPLSAVPGGTLRTLHGRSPRIVDAYVAPTAIVAGDVEMRVDSSVFFGCAVCAGDGRIVIGARTNVQDNCILATDRSRGDLVLGEGVTIGHNVQMGSGTIGDDALIGMGSRVGDGVVVERGACIGAGAWVEPGTVVPEGWIWAGRPARAFRQLKLEERKEFARARDIYVTYSSDYRSAGT